MKEVKVKRLPMVSEIVIRLASMRTAFQGFHKEGISLVKGQIVDVIYRCDEEGCSEGLSLKELADIVGICPSSASENVDGLVRDGFLSREPSPHDRRKILIKTTTRGRKKVDQADEAVLEVWKELTEGEDPEEIERFFGLLERIIERGRQKIMAAEIAKAEKKRLAAEVRRRRKTQKDKAD